ncbi:M1 family metallopeptidase [bacterium]|nr:M1 family metallopeptidase [bacterium]
MKRSLILTVITILIGVCGLTSVEASRPYWQQDVAYQMDVRLAEDGRTLLGTLEFSYQNNSPDTLTELRFHAHYNTFRPGSPAHRRWNSRGSRRIDNADPTDYGSLSITRLQDAAGKTIDPLFNYAIFTVPLTEPLLPGNRLTLSMDFESYIPGLSIAYRSAYGRGQLKVAHWYPQVCVYDPVMGWVDNQYMGTGEAYGEFGSYDVTLELPEPFIVGGTGVLVNRNEALPADLRAALDLSHYLDWPWGAKPDTTYGDWNKRKTWHFHAENVHDFAWAADPTFRIDQDRCGETDIWILVRQDHATGWHDAAELTREGMEILEREIGTFPYPEFTVADVFSGMEYPGIVFCGGRSPHYKLLFWHEMAHNYFMGALGSNQTDRSCLDEGFTTYWELRIMEELLGEDNILRYQKGNISIWDKNRWYRGFRPYLQHQKSGYILPLHVQADVAEVYLQYRVSSYYKPATMFYALQSYIGEAGIRRVMHDYYAEWKTRHPYEQDFLQSAEETLGTSLQWFYEAWVRGTKSLDYSLRQVRGESDDKIGLRLHREADMILPQKVAVESEDGSSLLYYIPLDVEPTPPDCAVRLPRWDQCRDPYPYYFFEIDKAGFKRAQLDPQGYLADVNPLNNSTDLLPPLKVEFDAPFPHISPLDAYRVRWAPTVGYNDVDGFKGGVYFDGDFMESWKKLYVSANVGAKSGAVSGRIRYEDDFTPLGRGSTWNMGGYLYDGQRGGELGLRYVNKTDYDAAERWHASLTWKLHELFNSDYPPIPQLWEDGILSALALDGAVTYDAAKIRLSVYGSVETSAPLSDFEYHRSSTVSKVTHPLHRNLEFSLRAFFGTASESTPMQAYYGLGGAGPWAQSTNILLRAGGALPHEWNARMPGDGNLRGYYGSQYYARTAASVQGELGVKLQILNELFTHTLLPPRYLPRFEVFLFGGAGDLGAEIADISVADYLSEAGCGLTVEFPFNVDVELAFPLYLSEPYAGEENWEFRAVIGVAIEK